MKKKILFINPDIKVEKRFIDYPYFINLGMLQLVSILKNNGYIVDVIDRFAQNDSDATEEGGYIKFGSRSDINKIIEEKEFDVAVIINSPFLTLFSSKKNNEILELIKKIKLKPNKPKIILADCYVGGMHYVDYDEKKIIEKYPLIDGICKYESDIKLIPLIEENCPKRKNKDFLQKLDNLPFPDYDSISMKNYTSFLKKVSKNGFSPFLSQDKNTMGIFTSRGCVYNCIFCSSKLSGRYYRAYSLGYIKQHLLVLKEKYSIKKVVILDELVNPNKKRLDNLLKLLENLDLDYEFPNGVRADNISAEALSMMKNRISLLSTSAESGCSNIVNEVIKKNLNLASIIKLAKLCAKKNIPLAVHFMIGLPEESYKDINKTLEFAIKLSENYRATPLIQLATPIPGSELFAKLKLNKMQEQNLLDNYLKYFSIGNKFFKIPSQSLDLFIKNFNLRLNSKETEKIIINVTYACNNNCIFCAVGNWKDRKPSLELQKRRLKQAQLQGIRMVDFDGGEPTLDKNLVNLIKFSKTLKFKSINLITNGRLLSVKKNAETIIRNGVTSIIFSLHGPNEKIHEQITRARGSFNQTIQGIKNVLEINGHIKNPVEVMANITLTNRNILYLNDFFRMIEKMKIKKVNMQFITPFGLAKKKDLPKKEDVSRILPKVIKKYSDKIKIQIINLPFCYLKGYEDYLFADVSKIKRNMMFIGSNEQNLAGFLASKRYKDEKCNCCEYSIICGGEWNFENNV